MKTLVLSFTTKNKQGFYSDDWITELKKQFNCDSHVLGQDDLPDIKNYDLIILGHSFINYIIKLSKIRGISITKNFYLNIVFNNDSLLSKIKESKAIKILFSKNDYKNIKVKCFALRFLKIKTCITHSLNSFSLFNYYRNNGFNTELVWLPFGVNDNSFSDLTKDRQNKIGFRGNLNLKYNSKMREKIVNDCFKYFGKESKFLDIKTGTNEFLGLKDYTNWMNSITICLNTESAIGTVGPKFWEQMICGVVPLAPVSKYEGLFLPRLNYIPIDINNNNWLKDIEKYLNEPHLLNKIKNENSNLVKKYTIKNLCTIFKTYVNTLSE